MNWDLLSIDMDWNLSCDRLIVYNLKYNFMMCSTLARVVRRDQELIFMYNFVLFFCLSLIYGNELLASTSRNNRVILLFVYAWTLRKLCAKESGMCYLEVPTFVVWHHAGNKERYVIVMWVGTVSLKNFSCWWAHCRLPDDAWVITEQWWNVADKETQVTQREICPVTTLSTSSPMDCSVCKPGSPWWEASE